MAQLKWQDRVRPAFECGLGAVLTQLVVRLDETVYVENGARMGTRPDFRRDQRQRPGAAPVD